MSCQQLLSVGIDIGTSTTQLVFSEITIKNKASAFSVPNFQITDKKILYKSDIHLTPLKSPELIDEKKVADIIRLEYKKAGFSLSSPDTGAVIITGETARKENARAVLQQMSDFSGDFVVATAGADLEGVLSGKGAGADKISYNMHSTCANLDIGGGTTNISLFDNGEIKDTACFDIGGRLIKYDSNKIVTYISEKTKKIIEKENINIKTGQHLNLSELDKILDIYVKTLFCALTDTKAPYLDLLVTNKALSSYPEKLLTFSGGVAECIYTPPENPYNYGDIGPFLAQKIKNSAIFSDFSVQRSTETIRATVVGAGSHTTKISGSTIFYDKEILPLKNVPVVYLNESSKTEYLKKRDWFDNNKVAIAMKGIQSPSFKELNQIAEKIEIAVSGSDEPLILIFECDMGKAFGYALKNRLPNKKIISIDGITLKDGDYIDIGTPVSNGIFLPVIVKTLLFQ